MRKYIILISLAIATMAAGIHPEKQPIKITLEPSYTERFDLAVELIKQHEGWHNGENGYYGYGHKKLPHEKFTRLTEKQADKLLRKDLQERVSYFNHVDDSLLLGVLAYNVGHSRILGYGKFKKSELLKRLEAGRCDVKNLYISYHKWKGKPIKSIKKRREVEFENLYNGCK